MPLDLDSSKKLVLLLADIQQKIEKLGDDSVEGLKKDFLSKLALLLINGGCSQRNVEGLACTKENIKKIIYIISGSPLTTQKINVVNEGETGRLCERAKDLIRSQPPESEEGRINDGENEENPETKEDDVQLPVNAAESAVVMWREDLIKRNNSLIIELTDEMDCAESSESKADDDDDGDDDDDDDDDDARSSLIELSSLSPIPGDLLCGKESLLSQPMKKTHVTQAGRLKHKKIKYLEGVRDVIERASVESSEPSSQVGLSIRLSCLLGANTVTRDSVSSFRNSEFSMDNNSKHRPCLQGIFSQRTNAMRKEAEKFAKQVDRIHMLQKGGLEHLNLHRNS